MKTRTFDKRTREYKDFIKRSESARKGWETRRMNERLNPPGVYYEAPVFMEDDIYEIDY